MKKRGYRKMIDKIDVKFYLILLLVLTIFMFSSDQITAQGKRFVLEDVAKMVGLGSPQISPDGKQIVLSVSRQNLKDNRYDRELVLVNVADGSRRVLTYNRTSVGSQKWSPSGDRLAFLAPGKNKKTQIYIMSFKGGDPKPITNHPTGVGSYIWSPDGKEIAFLAKEEDEKKEGEGKHNKAFQVGDHSYLLNAPPKPNQIWLTSADGGDVTQLTSGKTHNGSINWSPDGNSIVYTNEPAPFKYFESSIKVINIRTKEQRTLVSQPAGSSSPMYSPDGKIIAYRRSTGPEIIFNPSAIYQMPASGGKEVMVSKDIDRNLSGYWMPDGKSMLLSGTDLTVRALWLLPKGKKPYKIDLGKIQSSSISFSKKGALAFTAVEPQNPVELYYMASIKSKPKKLTNFNQEVASRNFGHVETIHWQGPDGFKENGVLVFPPDYDKNKKHPLVLSIQGIPASGNQ